MCKVSLINEGISKLFNLLNSIYYKNHNPFLKAKIYNEI